jgi:uncharacterized membrane protein YdbT with pleckstrin-like domain
VDPEPGERVFFHGHPSWRAMPGFYLKGLLGAVGAGAATGLASAAVDHTVQALWVALAVLVVFAIGLIGAMLKRAQTTYTITDRRLTIERGLLSREVHETALDRVQNVAARQSVLERILGIGTVDFDTAGAESNFRFTGVEHPRRIVRTVDRALHYRAGETAASSPAASRRSSALSVRSHVKSWSSRPK